jgi:SAM-dependent methyltransferase
MHRGNELFWERCRERYPQFFVGKRVLECGSRDHNGSVRRYFEGCDYTGIDWRPGEMVDVVSLIHDYNPKHRFDVVISASMLEHDPHWKNSLDRMVDLMREDGILLLSWGGAENPEHCLDDAPDGLFHPLPAWQVVKRLFDREVDVQEFVYEETLSGATNEQGCVALVGFKDASLARREPEIQAFHDRDLE